MIIDAEERISQQELSQRTGIDPSTMLARMDLLVEPGRGERARSSGDRRSYEIRRRASTSRRAAEGAREALLSLPGRGARAALLGVAGTSRAYPR